MYFNIKYLLPTKKNIYKDIFIKYKFIHQLNHTRNEQQFK